MAATDARPVPRKNVAFRFYFAIRKPSDSTLITTWAGADSEVSLDGGAFADCTNESTEIGTTGCGYIDLTAAEMNADAVILKVTVTNTGAVPLVFTLFPEESGDYRADVVQFGGTNLTAAGGIPEVKVASIATDAVNAAALADNAVTEIQNGLATATNVTDAQTAIVAQIDANETKIDSIQSDTNDIQSRLPAALEGGRIAAALDSAAINAVADAVLTESILDHRNVANSLAKYVWQIRQANLTIDGTVSNAITPTTLTFASNVVATTSAYAHAVLLFVTGPLAGENSPILTYTNANGVFLLEEPLTAAPSNGDEFVVIAGSHVHSVADIQSGLARTGADSDTLETLSDQLDTIGANVSSVASVSREAY